MKEIERKYLVKELPNLETTVYNKIEQGYLNTENEPIIRIRKYNDSYFLTYKLKLEDLICEEHELPLTNESYNHLKTKIDNNLITKRRYLLELDNNLTAELDIFEGFLQGLILVEVEFKTIEEANSFIKPLWFGEEVTNRREFRNAELAKINLPKEI